MCTTDRHDGSCPACETDEWIVPSGLTSPETARREPEPVHAPTLTPRGFTEALRALGRDGGEPDRCGRGSCCLMDGHEGRCNR